MRVDSFRGRTVREALEKVRDKFGDEALVIRTRGRSGVVEVLATTAVEFSLFGALLESPAPKRQRGRRCRVVALVGPTGSGKTTTAAKLALSSVGFGGSRVGIISLDTFKIGAYEQIQTYTDLAGLPLEVIRNANEAAGALERLAKCDVVIVDAPGRTPQAGAEDSRWRTALAALKPDEVHLVMPGSIRESVAEALVHHFASVRPTHLLLTKLDEVPDEDVVASLAGHLAMPTRWVTDGQSVPEDIDRAPRRLVAALVSERGGRQPKRATA